MSCVRGWADIFWLLQEVGGYNGLLGCKLAQRIVALNSVVDRSPN